MSDHIHIVFGLYDPKGDYSKHVAVVMASILKNTKSYVHFHVLHDATLSNINMQKLERMVMQGNRIDFINVGDYFCSLKKTDINVDKLCTTYTRGTLFRLVLPEVLPELEKVIYLDGDIVVTMDIKTLWDIDMKGCTIAGVVDWHEGLKVPVYSNILTERGIDKNKYICAGVLIMNLAKIRLETAEKGTLLSRALSFFKKYAPELPDQDFLNWEYYTNICYLNRQFDYIIPGEKEDLTTPRIWHFGGTLKPWLGFTDTNTSTLYWEYLLQTPWADEWHAMLYHAATESQYYHRHSSDCIKRILAQVKDDIRKIFIR